jgi:hypothetical protein
MSASRTLTCTVAVERGAKGSRRLVVAPPLALPPVAPGRVPRVARLLALAHQFEGLLRRGVVRDYVTLARLGHVSRVQITHIMNLLQLAPDIQEAILFLPPTEHGRDPVRTRHVRPIAQILAWRHQRVRWRKLIAEKYPHVLMEFPGGRSPDEVLD